MRTLDVPTSSITDVKRSPMAVFRQSEIAENGVYVLSRGAVAGVMLTREQYEALNRRIDELEDALIEQEAAFRIQYGGSKRYRDEDVRDESARSVAFSPFDGWE